MAAGSYKPKTGPGIYDVNSYIQAGIDPKTGLPLKATSGDPDHLVSDIKRILRIMDGQTAYNRYTWVNVPEGLTGELIERVLYYKGQAAFFYMEALNKFYFLPYALNGTIDVYGRFNDITPLPWKGTVDGEGKQKPWIEGLKKHCVYEVMLDDEVDEKVMKDSCVLLHDYSKQMSETNIARQILNDPILENMAEAYPMARTSLIANSGIAAMRVNDESQAVNVEIASKAMQMYATTGRAFIPITGNIDFQGLTNGGTPNADPYLLYMESLNNFRLATYGIENGGIFEKRSGVNAAEMMAMGTINVGEVYQDGLKLRQQFCDIVNSIWDLNIMCIPNEQMMMAQNAMMNNPEEGSGNEEGGSENDD